VLGMANNRDEMIIQAELDLTKAGRKYAREVQDQPVFLLTAGKQMLALCKGQLRKQGVK